MDDTNCLASAWALCGTRAELHSRALSGHIEVAHPDWGLQAASLNGIAAGGPLLAIARDGDKSGNGRWPLSTADVFVRGRDLVATYEPADDWPFAPQICWHADSLNAVDDVPASLALLISVQTHLLDTHPRLSITSTVRGSEQLCIAVSEGDAIDVRPAECDAPFLPQGNLCCVLRRLANHPTSYLEIVPAADFREAHIHAAPQRQSQLAWQFFSEFLEKGVIRRARIYAAFVPQEKDVELAVECCAAIERAPLPLTA